MPRIDLELTPMNKSAYAVADEVVLDLMVKNTPKIIVNVYEVNCKNFYLNERREVPSDLNLSGTFAFYVCYKGSLFSHN